VAVVLALWLVLGGGEPTVLEQSAPQPSPANAPVDEAARDTIPDPRVADAMRRVQERVAGGDEFGALEILLQTVATAPGDEATLAKIEELSSVAPELEIVGLGGSVKSLTFFETGLDELRKRDEPGTVTRFGRDETRAIAYELQTAFPPPTNHLPHTLGSVWYWEGKILVAHRAPAEIPPKAIGNRYVGSVGWREAGRWERGHYRVDLYVDGRKIAAGGFEVR
jgi:hypothetical protein